jgi:hypothetical protein
VVGLLHDALEHRDDIVDQIETAIDMIGDALFAPRADELVKSRVLILISYFSAYSKSDGFKEAAILFTLNSIDPTTNA